MKLLRFNLIIKTIVTILGIPLENLEKNENLRIPIENQPIMTILKFNATITKNHENLRIAYEYHKIKKKQKNRIQRENQ